MPLIVDPATPITFVVPDVAASVIDGVVRIDLGAAAVGVTTNETENLSNLTPSPGILTDALNGADTRITAAQAAADAAQSDATAASVAAASAETKANDAQSDANAAQAAADAAQVDADTAIAGLAGKQDTIAPGTVGNLAVSTGSAWLSTSTATYLFGRSSPFFVECITDPAATGLARSLVGTGQVSGTAAAYSDDHPGQWNFIIGSGSGSRATMFLGPSVGGLVTPTINTILQWEVMLQVSVTSTAGQTFEVLCGLADSPANTLVFNGVYFYVDVANNLIARRTVGGVNTDTAIAPLVAGAWYRMRTVVTGGNTVLSYAQTSNRTAALTTVLTAPNIVAAQGPQLKLIRQTGATTRTVTADYFAWYLPST